MRIGSSLKQAALATFQIIGLNRLCRIGLRDKLLVLGYHGVVQEEQKDRFGYGNTVSVEEFRQHLEILRRNFHPVSAAEVLTCRQRGTKLPAGAALVTFDDGYRNNLTLAAPVLKDAGVPCIFHVSTGYIGTPRILWTDEVIGRILRWPGQTLPVPEGGETDLPANDMVRRNLAVRIKERCKRLPTSRAEEYLSVLRSSPDPDFDDERYKFMSWDEVRSLQQQGFEIGSHTVDHPILTRIPLDRRDRELLESKNRIEQELGAPCPCIAYPNGGVEDISGEVLQSARKAGYRLGFTIAETHSDASDDDMAISRICIQGHLPLDAFLYRVDGLERLFKPHSVKVAVS